MLESGIRGLEEEIGDLEEDRRADDRRREEKSLREAMARLGLPTISLGFENESATPLYAHLQCSKLDIPFFFFSFFGKHTLFTFYFIW